MSRNTTISASFGLALLVSLSSGCVVGEFDEPGTTDLAIPEVEVVGGDIIGGSEIDTVRVATAAALFQDGNPESWGVEITGTYFPSEVDAPDVNMDQPPTLLSEIDTNSLQFPSSNEANFDVDLLTTPVFQTGSFLELCGQIVHFTPGGDKYLGSASCQMFGDF